MPVKNYTFKCIRAGGLGPGINFESCMDDEHARQRALSLFELWPLAVRVEVSEGDRHFEIERPPSL